jgi:hypothetical protein
LCCAAGRKRSQSKKRRRRGTSELPRDALQLGTTGVCVRDLVSVFIFAASHPTHVSEALRARVRALYAELRRARGTTRVAMQELRDVQRRAVRMKVHAVCVCVT